MSLRNTEGGIRTHEVLPYTISSRARSTDSATSPYALSVLSFKGRQPGPSPYSRSNRRCDLEGLKLSDSAVRTAMDLIAADPAVSIRPEGWEIATSADAPATSPVLQSADAGVAPTSVCSVAPAK